ncbi:MAG: MEMAR_RS02690 family S-layer glycoprotein [Methanoregula sp.]|nr:MEMAR_RS02690 family S-layer glycoprotein [Methanoregula sp.]
MTKRLTIALVAVVLFVLMAVMPVSAYNVAQNISQGASIFIGESGINLSHAQTSLYGRAGDTTAGVGPIIPAIQGVELSTGMTVGWWASAAVIQSTNPTKTVLLTGRNLSFTVAPTDFVGYTGNWYIVNSTDTKAMTPAIFNVQDPSLVIAPYDLSLSTGQDMSGKSVVQGQQIVFKVDTNMYAAINNLNRFPSSTFGAQSNPSYFNNIRDGYIDIKVKDPSGTTLTALVNASAPTNYPLTLLQQNVSTATWYWGTAPSTWMPGSAAATPFYSNWSTAALDANGQYYYPPGTYTITAESWLNAMKDNYKNAGADYTGKTVTAAVTMTLVSDSIKIEANKDSVVRSKPFAVTITGKPSTLYHMWVKGTSSMDGSYDNQPPMITPYQAGVVNDSATPSLGLGVPTGGIASMYQIQNGAGQTIFNNVYYASGYSATVGPKVQNGTLFYANVTTSATGTRTVEWQTTNWTKAQTYTIRVEQQFNASTYNSGYDPSSRNMKNKDGSDAVYNTGTYRSDEVNVKVEKGAVTIVAAGSQSYYLGEEIKFSGTNTETYTTYMFITGPNLPTRGGIIYSTDPRAALGSDGEKGVQNRAAADYQQASVLADNTWSWKWGTSTVALDAGTYTIYAVSQPNNAADQNLQNAAFGTVSIIIKKPFVSATASQSTVAQGDKIIIAGTAQGQPTLGVKIWILGKNYPATANQVKTQSVNADASFKYELAGSDTKSLYPGQYFVVVQHPMQNNVFDIDAVAGTAGTTDAGKTVVINKQLSTQGTTTASKVFTLLGAGSLQGSDAAEALVQGINSANVDDTYTKLQFLVEVPVIRINPVGDKHVGDKFTITASTNLAVDDEILVTVYSSSFKPTQKSQSGEFSGATGTVKVTKGDSGMNMISFPVDSSTFKPDEYIVTASAILQVATGTALFNVLEGAAPVVTTKAPVVVTTVAPVVTTVAPVVTTAVPTTPKPAPGYGALIALIGLGAVAFIVVRRH